MTILRVYPITPCPKPRMTQRDRWAKRPAVLKYRAFADECRLRHMTLNADLYHIVFVLKMPRSWKPARQAAHEGRRHLPRPDKDNLEKALLDAVLPGGDSAAFDGRVTKLWGLWPLIAIADGTLHVREPVNLRNLYAAAHAARDHWRGHVALDIGDKPLILGTCEHAAPRAKTSPSA